MSRNESEMCLFAFQKCLIELSYCLKMNMACFFKVKHIGTYVCMLLIRIRNDVVATRFNGRKHNKRDLFSRQKQLCIIYVNIFHEKRFMQSLHYVIYTNAQFYLIRKKNKEEKQRSKGKSFFLALGSLFTCTSGEHPAFNGRLCGCLLRYNFTIGYLRIFVVLVL